MDEAVTNGGNKRSKLEELAQRSSAGLRGVDGRSANQLEQAYDAIEERLVNCQLQPGRFISLQGLQDLVGLGRTPVHQAVNRMAADTLIHVHPRRGLQIAAIDLSRERMLLQLRREMERLVIRLATQYSTVAQRNQMLHLGRYLRDRGQNITLDEFNVVDHRMDQLFLAAAGEPFIENTLRPLHILFRRIGWLFHSHTQVGVDLQPTVQAHLAMLDAVGNSRVAAAIAASDLLMDFVDSTFDVLEREIDPVQLDCNIGVIRTV